MGSICTDRFAYIVDDIIDTSGQRDRIRVSIVVVTRHQPLMADCSGTPMMRCACWSSSYQAVGVLCRPSPWHEFVETRGRPQVDKLGEHVGQIGLRVDTVELAGFDERSNSGPVLRVLVVTAPGAARTTTPAISIVITPEPSATAAVMMQIRQHRDEQRCRVGRQAQCVGPRRLVPSEQMLWRDVVPARRLQHDRARRIGFRHDPSPDPVAPTAPTPHPDLDNRPRPAAPENVN
jgi:hypothetical protein